MIISQFTAKPCCLHFSQCLLNQAFPLFIRCCCCVFISRIICIARSPVKLNTKQVIGVASKKGHRLIGGGTPFCDGNPCREARSKFNIKRALHWYIVISCSRNQDRVFNILAAQFDVGIEESGGVPFDACAAHQVRRLGCAAHLS